MEKWPDDKSIRKIFLFLFPLSVISASSLKTVVGRRGDWKNVHHCYYVQIYCVWIEVGEWEK